MATAMTGVVGTVIGTSIALRIVTADGTVVTMVAGNGGEVVIGNAAEAMIILIAMIAAGTMAMTTAIGAAVGETTGAMTGSAIGTSIAIGTALRAIIILTAIATAISGSVSAFISTRSILAVGTG